MNFEQIKEIANKRLSLAQGMLTVDGYITPVLFSIDEYDNIKPCTVIMETKEDREMLQELIKKLSDTAKALILIMDSYFIDVPYAPDKSEEISKMEDAKEALSCFLYTKERALVRQMPYSFHEKENRYNFSDLGWETLDENYGNYKNPYDLHQ